METTRVTDNEEVRCALTIEPLALEEEFVRLPGDVAYYGALYADALKDALTAKQAFELIEARLQIETRASMAGGEKKPTEKVVEAAVVCNAEYQAAYSRLIVAESEKALARSRVDSLGAKKDMLVSLGATVRQELATSPTVRAQFAHKREEG
jgi:hypothetical protein